MTPELKEALIKAYTSALEAHNRHWEYLTLPLDEQFKLMQDYIKEVHVPRRIKYMTIEEIEEFNILYHTIINDIAGVLGYRMGQTFDPTTLVKEVQRLKELEKLFNTIEKEII
jgi:hypothetical protein